MDELALRDIHLPDAVSVWPLAPGWWLLMWLLAVLCTLAILYWKRGKIQRHALAQLREIEQRFSTDKDAQRLVSDISTLLRRVCLTYRPRTAVASLTGKAWRDALASLSGPRGALPDKVAWHIVHGPYNPAETIEPATLMTHTRRWLRALPSRGVGA